MQYICPLGHQPESRHNDATITCDCGLKAIPSHIKNGDYPLTGEKPKPQVLRIGPEHMQPEPIVIRRTT